MKTKYEKWKTEKLSIELDKEYEKVCEECADSGIVSRIVEMELELESRCNL